MNTQNTTHRKQDLLFYHEDGLMDLFIGMALLFIGGAFWADMIALGAIWVAIMAPLWTSARKTITARRAGFPSKPSPQALRIGFWLFSLLALLGIAAFFTLIYFSNSDLSTAFGSFLMANTDLALGIGLSGLILLLGAAFRNLRLLLYAPLCLAIFGAAALYGWPIWTSFLASGVLLCAGGSLTLLRFMTRYPAAAS